MAEEQGFGMTAGRIVGCLVIIIQLVLLYPSVRKVWWIRLPLELAWTFIFEAS